MQLIQTAPGQVFAISTSNGCTLTQEGMPDSIELSKGQSHVIAKGDWIQIDDTTALIYPAQGTTREVSVSLIGFGSLPGLSAFITNLITSIVGPGNASVTLDTATSTLTVAFALSVTEVQIAQVESLLERLLPKDVGLEIDPLPTDYIKAEFLENTEGSYVDTRITVTPDAGAMALVAPIYTGGFMAIGCQSAEGSNKRFFAPRYRRDSGEPGWGWGEYFDRTRSELVGLKVLPPPYPIPETVWQTQKINYKNNKLMELETDVSGYDSRVLADLLYTPGVTSVTLFAYNRPDGVGYLYSMRIKHAELTKGSQVVFSVDPCIAPNGDPCMYDKVTKTPFRNAGSGTFIVGMTTEQALNLSKLPVTEVGTLTVSLPGEAQLASTGVPAALQVAADRGWTITVRYRED